MIDRTALFARLRRLAYAAPGAFREDPVFRYAALGAVAALLMLPSRPGDHAASVPRPPPPPPPTALGGAGDSRTAEQPAAARAVGPIAPERPLGSALLRPDARVEPDRFGRLTAAQQNLRRAPE